MKMVKPGDQVTIDGVIHFGQDHSFWEGEFPQDLVFTVEKFINEENMKLTAPGYGGKPGTEDYGNGAIYVSTRYWERLRKQPRGRYGILARSMEP